MSDKRHNTQTTNYRLEKDGENRWKLVKRGYSAADDGAQPAT